MESELTFSYIDYEATDYDLVEAWYIAHDRRPCPAEWLPANGFIATLNDEPVAILFLYVDVTSSVGIVEWMVTRPGLSVKETRAAIRYLIEDPITERALELGCVALTCFAFKATAREAEKCGWTVDHREVFNMSKPI
jgi:hypothetical protein